MPRHYIFAQYFTVATFVLLAFAPIFLAGQTEEGQHAPGLGTFLLFSWPVLLGVLFIYVRDVCGSEQMSFGKAMVFIPWALRERGLIPVLLLGFPSILLVFFASVAITFYCKAFNKRANGPIYLLKLISRFKSQTKAL